MNPDHGASDQPMTLVYAHRGAAAEEPENTLASFRRALELGADALETDVHLTRDGEIVAIHDPDARRTTGVARAVREVTLAELQSWDAGYGFVDRAGARPFVGRGYRVPSLGELLTELPKVWLNVDLKSGEPALVERFIETVHRHGAEERVVAASFSSSTLRRLRERGYRGQSSLARADFLRCWLVPRLLQRKPPGTRAQIPTHVGPVPIATRFTLEKLHALGLGV
ncbi:MAG TPA: glycerophosphodiester phosphodiesterase family protein, partial [Polyangiaceae bacterium]|nr:glycerophosphodiester phosphodiesterase family protein [Polyangiaceae bacterium]